MITEIIIINIGILIGYYLNSYLNPPMKFNCIEINNIVLEEKPKTEEKSVQTEGIQTEGDYGHGEYVEIINYNKYYSVN